MARELREVLFEFRRVGKFVKVSCVDPITLTEVSIVGSPRASQRFLERAARRKLEYMLSNKSAPATKPRRTDQSGWNF